MKFKQTTALILSLIMLTALCACTKVEPRTAEAHHPVWQHDATPVVFEPSMPLVDMQQDGKAVIYELTPDFEEFRIAVSEIFKCDIDAMEKTQNGSSVVYKNDRCSLSYDEETGFWSYDRADRTTNKTQIGDELALIIAKDFVKAKGLCPDGWSGETVETVNDDSGLLFKTVTLYPTINGGTIVRGDYYLSICVNADGEIVQLTNNTAKLMGCSEVSIVAGDKVGDMMAKNGCGAGLELYKDDPYAENSQSLAYGYYADGQYLLPIYIITTTDSSGTCEVLVDAQAF